MVLTGTGGLVGGERRACDHRRCDMRHLTRASLAIAVLSLAGCASAASATQPPVPVSVPPVAAPSAAPSSGPGDDGVVTTPEQAAAIVVALDPRFAGVGPKNSDVIGGCCFYDVSETSDGYMVTIDLGWGDCPSGCISHHRWTYTVAADGTTTLVSETGDPVPAGFPEGGGSGDY